MYAACMTLESFTSAPASVQRGIIVHWVLALAEVNLAFLRMHPDTPPLYLSGVEYRAEPRGKVEIAWRDIPGIRRRRRADCKGLVGWRLAELWAAGETDARPEVIEIAPHEWHVILRRASGANEDPSARLDVAA